MLTIKSLNHCSSVSMMSGRECVLCLFWLGWGVHTTAVTTSVFILLRFTPSSQSSGSNFISILVLLMRATMLSWRCWPMSAILRQCLCWRWGGNTAMQHSSASIASAASLASFSFANWAACLCLLVGRLLIFLSPVSPSLPLSLPPPAVVPPTCKSQF